MSDGHATLSDIAIYRPSNMEVIREGMEIPLTASDPNSETLIEDIIKKMNTQDYTAIVSLLSGVFHRDVNFDRVIRRDECVYLVRRLRRYYKTNPVRQIDNIFNMLHNFDSSDSEEGFDIPTPEKPKKLNRISVKSVPDAPAIQIESSIVKQLENRLQQRDSVLQNLTTGYLKDIQHMRELLFRKYNSLDIFEVEYFDEKDGFNEKQTILLNNRLNKIKQQAEKKTTELMTSLLNVHEQHQAQMKINKQLEEKLAKYSSSTELLSLAFKIDNDPYRTWKHIQDIKGNSYFFQIFSHPKHHYGIDYREINKLLLVSNASQREVNYYKQLINDQLGVFMDKQVLHMDELRKEILEKDIEIVELQEKQKNLNEDIIAYMKKYVDDILIEKKQYIMQRLFQEHDQLYTLKDHYDQIRAKEMIQKWALLNQFRKSIVQTDLQRQIIQQITKQQQQVKCNCSVIHEELLQSVEQDKLKYVFQQYKLSKCDQDQNTLQLNIKQISDQNLDLKALIKVQMSKYDVLNQHYRQLIRMLDTRIGQLQIDQINITDVSRESTKHLNKTVKQLDQDKARKIQVVMKQQENQQESLNTFFAKISRSSIGTQTKLMDISNPIQSTFQDYNKVEKWIKMKMALSTEQRDQSVGTVDDSPVGSRAPSPKQTINTDQAPVPLALKQSIVLQQVETIEEQPHQSIIDINDEFVEASIQDQTIDVRPYSSNFRITKEDIKEYNLKSQLLGKAQRPKTTNSKVSQSMHQPKVQQDKNIFDRLFKDGKEKQTRLDILKHHMETLDGFKWEQILSIIHGNSSSGEQRKSNSQRTNRASHFYKAHKKQEQSEVLVNLTQSEANKTMYYENMLEKFKSKTKRMQGYYDKPSVRPSTTNKSKDEKFDFSTTFQNFYNNK